MSRLKSYTIIEMLVVMLVSSLSITISYTCYSIFSNQYIKYKKNSDELANYMLLDRLLTRDISLAKKVIRSSDGIVCLKKTEKIDYEFSSTYVLRKGILIDTFFVNATEQPIYNQLGVPQSIPNGLVDELALSLVYKEENLYFYYKKEYDASLFMNQNEME